MEFSRDNNPQTVDRTPGDTSLGQQSPRAPLQRKQEEPAPRAEVWAPRVSPLVAASTKAKADCRKRGWTCPNGSQETVLRCLVQGGTDSVGMQAQHGGSGARLTGWEVTRPPPCWGLAEGRGPAEAELLVNRQTFQHLDTWGPKGTHTFSFKHGSGARGPGAVTSRVHQSAF